MAAPPRLLLLQLRLLFLLLLLLVHGRCALALKHWRRVLALLLTALPGLLLLLLPLLCAISCTGLIVPTQASGMCRRLREGICCICL